MGETETGGILHAPIFMSPYFSLFDLHLLDFLVYGNVSLGNPIGHASGLYMSLFWWFTQHPFGPIFAFCLQNTCGQVCFSCPQLGQKSHLFSNLLIGPPFLRQPWIGPFYSKPPIQIANSRETDQTCFSFDFAFFPPPNQKINRTWHGFVFRHGRHVRCEAFAGEVELPSSAPLDAEEVMKRLAAAKVGTRRRDSAWLGAIEWGCRPWISSKTWWLPAIRFLTFLAF